MCRISLESLISFSVLKYLTTFNNTSIFSGGTCATNGPTDCKFENQECQDPSKDNAAVTTKGVAGAVCGCKAPFVDNMMGACENGPGMEQFIKISSF